MTTLLSRGFVLGVTFLGLLALIAYLLAAAPGRSQAIDPTVSVSSATAPPGSQVTVDVVVTPGTGVTIGALGIVVTYDDALLSASSCSTSTFIGTAHDCNTNLSPNQVGFAWVSVLPEGISGLAGTITFNTFPTEGVAFLAVTITTCADEVGNYLTCAAIDGEITIVQPTASPTPSPTATPQPTPVPTPKYWGDVNCSGTVDAVDALAILRNVAGLPVSQATPCPSIGAPYP